MMTQMTLESFLVTTDAEGRTKQADPRSSTFSLSSSSSSIASGLVFRDYSGTALSKHSRRIMEKLMSSRYRQVASLSTSSSMTESGQSHVSSISINQATGRVAWTHAHGILRMGSMHTLQQVAGVCQQQAAEAAEAAEDLNPGPADYAPEDRDQATADFERMRVLKVAAQCRAMQGSAGGRPYKLGLRLDDVVWDPHASCKVAVASSSSCITLIDFGKTPHTFTRLLTSKHPNSRMGCARYFPSGPYTLAASDRKAVHLWDARRGHDSVAELISIDSLESPVEVLPGSSLLCAVNSRQQLLLWDLRKASSSASCVKLLGDPYPIQHALLSRVELRPPLAAAQERQWAQQGGAPRQSLLLPEGQSHPPYVQRLVAHPEDPSRLALMLQNGGSALFDLARGSISSMAIAPHLFHDPAHQNISCDGLARLGSNGSWDGSGRRFWYPAMAFEDLPPLAAGPAEATGSGVSPYGRPGAGWMDTAANPLSCGSALASCHQGSSSNLNSDSTHLEMQRLSCAVFDVVACLGLDELSYGLQEAGVQPHGLFVNPAFVASGLGANEELLVAVRRWEDARRRACGPSRVVAMAEWPTCFACHWQSDDVLMGTRGGHVAVVRPSY